MGTNGTPPSARRMWHDRAAHACDFAQRYAEPLDYAVAQRMIEQGGPPCSSPASPPGPRQGWAAGSDRFWLLELRVF